MSEPMLQMNRKLFWYLDIETTIKMMHSCRLRSEPDILLKE